MNKNAWGKVDYVLKMLSKIVHHSVMTLTVKKKKIIENES